QASIVRRIVALSAGVARRVDARTAAQRRHHQPAILAERPLLQEASRFNRFLASVCLECRAVLDNVRRIGPGGQLTQVDRQISQDLAHLLRLLEVTGTEDDTWRHWELHVLKNHTFTQPHSRWLRNIASHSMTSRWPSSKVGNGRGALQSPASM